MPKFPEKYEPDPEDYKKAEEMMTTPEKDASWKREFEKMEHDFDLLFDEFKQLHGRVINHVQGEPPEIFPSKIDKLKDLEEKAIKVKSAHDDLRDFSLKNYLGGVDYRHLQWPNLVNYLNEIRYVKSHIK